MSFVSFSLLPERPPLNLPAEAVLDFSWCSLNLTLNPSESTFNLFNDSVLQTIILGFYFILISIIDAISASLKTLLKSKRFLYDMQWKNPAPEGAGFYHLGFRFQKGF